MGGTTNSTQTSQSEGHQGIGVISGSQKLKAANPVLMPAWPCRVVVTINKKKNLVVSVDDGATFEIVLHRTWKGSAVHQDFLGFYVLNSFRMSARTQGLLGMTGQPGRTVCWCSPSRCVFMGPQ